MDVNEIVEGDHLGISFPVTIAALHRLGAFFLTEAFHSSGVLEKNNSVEEITRFEEFFGGGMGRKLLLSVRYKYPQKELTEDLFVKLPWDSNSPLHALHTPVMEPEIHFALLSRHKDFPIVVPQCYFADYSSKAVGGILITERIAYGQGDIEPHIDKCQDYRLKSPLPYYQALTSTVAKLSGHSRSGNFGADVDQHFPFNPIQLKQIDLIPYSASELSEKLQQLKAFVKRYPQFFDRKIQKPEFLDRLVQGAKLALQNEIDIRHYLNTREGMVALCHPNGNVDNAWFWRDDSGDLNVGMLDWGSVGQMNLAQAFYGMVFGAELDFLNTHRSELIALFLSTYKDQGGPQIDPDDFLFCYKLSVATNGIAWVLGAPTIIKDAVPDLQSVPDRYDTRLYENFLARAYLQLLVVFLNEWEALDITSALETFGSNRKRLP